MKINWGSGIAIFYVVFASVLLFSVYKSTTYDNSLVEENYYAKDIAYQEHYNKLVNAKSLKQDLKVIELPQKQSVAFYFPKELGKPSGKIHFFCPSHSNLDFELEVDTDGEATQYIPIEDLKKGLWKVKVDWQADGKAFYKEEALVI